MRKNMHPTVAVSLAAMLLLSVFSGVVAAPAVSPMKEDYKALKDRYNEYKNRYDKATGTYQDAVAKYQREKSKSNEDELRNRTREVLLRAIDAMIAHIEVLKIRAVEAEANGTIPFKASENFAGYITELEAKKTDVQNAQTRADFVTAIKSIKEIWTKVNLEVKYAAGYVITTKIGDTLTKADNLAARLEEEIAKQKAAGRDVSRLEEKLNEFKEWIAEARTSYDSAKSAYASPTGFDSNGKVTDVTQAVAFLKDINGYLRDALKDIKKAFSTLKDLYREVVRHRAGLVVLKGTGNLTAEGNGRVLLTGNITVSVESIKNSKMRVSNNTVVTTTGANVTREVLGNGDVKYTGFDTATATGTNIKVVLSGNSIKLTAEGTGIAVLKGKGTYSVVKEASGEWSEAADVEEIP